MQELGALPYPLRGDVASLPHWRLETAASQQDWLPVSPEELARGMMLAPAGLFRAGKRLDVEINLLHSARPLKDRARVHLHAYTAETIAEDCLPFTRLGIKLASPLQDGKVVVTFHP